LWRDAGDGARAEFVQEQRVPVAGNPTSIVAADFGGLPGPDIAVGFRDTDDGFGGRVEIFTCDAHTLPPRGSDPSAGRLAGWVPALAGGAFAAGAHPRPALAMDGLAAGVHTGPLTGQMFVFVR
jgi:hypothetical protein